MASQKSLDEPKPPCHCEEASFPGTARQDSCADEAISLSELEVTLLASAGIGLLRSPAVRVLMAAGN